MSSQFEAIPLEPPKTTPKAGRFSSLPVEPPKPSGSSFAGLPVEPPTSLAPVKQPTAIDDPANNVIVPGLENHVPDYLFDQPKIDTAPPGSPLAMAEAGLNKQLERDPSMGELVGDQVDFQRAEFFRNKARGGTLTGSTLDHAFKSGWETSMANRYSSAAIKGDRDTLRQLQSEDDEITRLMGSTMDLSKSNLGGKIVKGAAGSIVPMVEGMAIGGAAQAIPVVGGVAGKAATGAYWQQQGAGQFMRSFLQGKDIDSLSDEQLKQMNQISQGMGVPYAAVELIVSSIPGMKALGSSVDRQIANAMMRKAMANPTVMKRIATEGISFAIRFGIESLIEEGAQGGIDDATRQMLDKVEAGDTKALFDYDWSSIRNQWKKQGVESMPAVFGITALGGTPGSIQNVYSEVQADRAEVDNMNMIDQLVRDSMRPENAQVKVVERDAPKQKQEIVLPESEMPQGETDPALYKKLVELDEKRNQPIQAANREDNAPRSTTTGEAAPIPTEQPIEQAAPQKEKAVSPPPADTPAQADTDAVQSPSSAKRTFVLDTGAESVNGEIVSEDENSVTVRTDENTTRRLNKKFWNEQDSDSQAAKNEPQNPTDKESLTVEDEAKAPVVSKKETDEKPIASPDASDASAPADRNQPVSPAPVYRTIAEAKRKTKITGDYGKNGKGVPLDYWHFSPNSGRFDQHKIPAWFSRNKDYAPQRLRQKGAKLDDSRSKPFFLDISKALHQAHIGVRNAESNPWSGEVWIKKIPSLDGVLDPSEKYTLHNIARNEKAIAELSKRYDAIMFKESGYDVVVMLKGEGSIVPINLQNKETTPPASKASTTYRTIKEAREATGATRNMIEGGPGKYTVREKSEKKVTPKKNLVEEYAKAFGTKATGRFVESDAKTWDEAGRPTFKGSPEYKAWRNNMEAARLRLKASQETDKALIADLEDAATLLEAKAKATLDNAAKKLQKVNRNEEERLRKSNARRNRHNVEEERDGGGGDVAPVQKEPSETQKKVRAEFARKQKPVDERLAEFRKNHPYVRAPEAGNLERGINRDPLYMDLMGPSAKEGGIIPRSNFRAGHKHPKWDQLLGYARGEIPHIIGDEDTGVGALSKIYGFKLETVGDQEAQASDRLSGEENEYVFSYMKRDIEDGNLPSFEDQNQFPEIFQKALDATGVDPATLDPVDYPDSVYDELAEIAAAYDEYLDTQKSDAPKETIEEWEKRMGIEHGPEQAEMFGKGAVGDNFELRPETIKGRDSFSEKKAKEAKAKQAEDDQMDVFDRPARKMNKTDLQTRAKELGVQFEQTTPMDVLRRKVRQAESGGFVDVSVATAKDGKQHKFIKQQRENDRRVHSWHNKQKRKFLTNLAATTVDRQADIKKALLDIGGDEAVRRLVLKQGASAEASRQYEEAEHEINKILPRKNHTLFKDYIAAMRVIEATKVQADKDVELKSPVEVEAAKDWINNEFQNMPETERDSIMEAAQVYWGVMNKQLSSLHEEGLIGDEGYKTITENHKFYSPRRFVEFIDPVTQNPKGESSHDSGVKNLGEGSESALAQDPFYLMAHVITRTQSRVFQNRANMALYDLSQTESGKDFIRPLKRFQKENKNTDNITYKFEPHKRNEGLVKVFIDGVETRMAMDGRMAEEWNGLPPALSQDMALFLQWASGTKVLKALATGVNPEFAVSNLPRDAMYAWFSSGQYNSVLPVGVLQLAADYARVTKDAVTKNGAYADYIKEGGGMDFLTTQGFTRKPEIEGGNRAIKKIGEVLAWAGETSEIATRLAVRNRAIKNGMTGEQATYAARNMLDFSQGGTYAKAADNVVPYLNAAIQGTRGGFRAFKTNPVQSSFKAAQLVSIGYGMAWAVAHFFPALWDSIDEREKATKWIIPLPWKETDKNGNTRHAYLAIAKDQFQQFFAAVGQSMADGQSGRPWSGQVISSIQAISPVDATTLPPVASASIAYFGNYDTWTREKVWKGYEDISAYNEFSYRTPEIAHDVADTASKIGINVSPDRMAAATSKIVPYSNPLAGTFSAMYSAMQGDEENAIGETTVEKVKATPVLRRMLRFSRSANVQPYTLEDAGRLDIDTTGMTDQEARDAVKKAATKQADKRQPLNVALDKFMADTDKLTGASVRVWLRDNVEDIEERKRLWQRAKNKYPDKVGGSYKTSSSRRKSRSRR